MSVSVVTRTTVSGLTKGQANKVMQALADAQAEGE